MPNRILRDWTDSFAVAELDANAERLFVRLIMKVDDYGRYHADPRILKGHCFPLLSSVRDTDISRWLDALDKAGLIVIYEDVKSRKYLQIQNFNQQIRAQKSKFPDPAPDHQEPPEKPSDSSCNHLLSNDVPDESEVEDGDDNRPDGLIDDKPPSVKINYQKIVDDWNVFAENHGLSKVDVISPKRKQKIKTRLAEGMTFEAVFPKIAVSPFLKGVNKNNWRVSFDWIIANDSNWCKIIEGNYDLKTPASSQNKAITKQDYSEEF